jgi:hypothetical protein
MEGIPDDVERVISFVSRDIARKNPPVEREDIQQELRLYWLSTDKAQRINGSLLQTHLYSWALEWAQKERAEWHGMSVHYYYTPDTVRASMKVLFTYPRQDWEQAYCPDDAKTRGRWSDGLEVMFDAVMGFEGLDEDSQQIIAYVNAMDRADNLTDLEKKRHQRAVHKLTKTMNTLKNQRGEDLKFTGRKAMTNAAARALIGDQN